MLQRFVNRAISTSAVTTQLSWELLQEPLKQANEVPTRLACVACEDVFSKLRFTFFIPRQHTFLRKIWQDCLVYRMLASCQDGLIGLASGTALGAASMVVRPKVQWSSDKTSAWFHMDLVFFGYTLVFTWIPQGVHWCKLSSLESYLAISKKHIWWWMPNFKPVLQLSKQLIQKPIVDIWIWTHQASFLGTHLWWPVKFPLSAAQASGRFTGCCREDRTGRWRCRARPLSWLLRLAETSAATLPPRGEEPINWFLLKGQTSPLENFMVEDIQDSYYTYIVVLNTVYLL